MPLLNIHHLKKKNPIISNLYDLIELYKIDNSMKKIKNILKVIENILKINIDPMNLIRRIYNSYNVNAQITTEDDTLQYYRFPYIKIFSKKKTEKLKGNKSKHNSSIL